MQGISPHGKTDPAIAREILRVRLGKDATEANGEIRSILNAYLLFLKEEVQTSLKYRVLPGINSILDEMSTRSDVALGLATGNLEAGARIKLDRGGLNRYFAFGGFGSDDLPKPARGAQSDSEDRTELVRKAADEAAARCGKTILSCDIFVIGDTPLDIDAGKRAGFKTVGVATGSYSIEQLLDCGANFAIPDFDEGRDHFLRSTFIA